MTGEPEDRGHPPVPNRNTEPFIYLPRPPKGWTPIRVRAIHDLAVILTGMVCIGSQIYADVVQHMEPHYWLIIAGLTCLGYEGALRLDRRKLQNGRE